MTKRRTHLEHATLLAGALALVAGACSSSGGDAQTMNVTTGDPGPGGLYLTASGEATAVTGYPFPPASADDTFLVDGWSFKLDHEIITIDHVKLWETPDKVPADQSQHGAEVAHADGPWAIDLHLGGPLTGEGGAPEQAQPFAGIKSKDNGGAFDTTIGYAFGFETIPATAAAIKVNLDAEGQSDYDYMVQHGYSVLYVGTVSRPATDPCATAGGAAYDFSKLPTNCRIDQCRV